MHGMPYRGNKAAFLTFSGVVWMGPCTFVEQEVFGVSQFSLVERKPIS